MRELWAAFLDAVLGARCVLCGIRVFPQDRQAHSWFDHADEDAAA